MMPVADYQSFEAGFKACAKSMGYDWVEVAPMLDQAFGFEWFDFKRKQEGE